MPVPCECRGSKRPNNTNSYTNVKILFIYENTPVTRPLSMLGPSSRGPCNARMTLCSGARCGISVRHISFPLSATSLTPPSAYECVWLVSGSGPSQSPSALSVTAQRAGAGVLGLHHGRRGVAPVSVVCALRGSLSCPWWVPRPCVSVWRLDGTRCGVV